MVKWLDVREIIKMEQIIDSYKVTCKVYVGEKEIDVELPEYIYNHIDTFISEYEEWLRSG